MKQYKLTIKLLNTDSYKIEDLSIIIEQNYQVIQKKDVELNLKEISFTLKKGEYKIYAIFSTQGLSYITPQTFVSIPEIPETEIDIAKSEIDDVLVDPI